MEFSVVPQETVLVTIYISWSHNSGTGEHFSHRFFTECLGEGGGGREGGREGGGREFYTESRTNQTRILLTCSLLEVLKCPFFGGGGGITVTFACSSLEGESCAALRAEKCISVSTPQSRQASAMARAPSTHTSLNLKFLRQ